MKINLFTKPSKEVKNPTTGDFWKDHDGTINVAVQELGNEDYEFLIALHSLIEGFLIEKNKLDRNLIEYFDKTFKQNKEGLITNQEDPGDDTAAPYHKEHTFATFIEMQVANEMNVSWDKYN